MAEQNPDDNQNGGSGRDALAGYEYQMDVSVWLALYLLVANKQAQELTLEPASQEDIEGVLAETEPGHVTGNIRLKTYNLVVQAKLRTGDAWTAEKIKSLLKYGSEKRPSAAQRLANPEIRYLLVTSAGLNGKSADLRVRQPGLWPKSPDLPISIAKALPPGAAGRVAVIGNKEPDQLQTEIRLLLMDSFRVPNARWQGCLKDLREDARIRIRGVDHGRWLREDLERAIRKHGGYLASTPELELYVKPTNWDQLRHAIRDNHGAVIIGPSGTGKTLATRMLYEELRQEIPNLERRSIRLGPQELEDDQTPPPVLYDIEDPWGRYSFDPKSRPWNDQLDRFLSKATHDRVIVATTRQDVAEQANAVKMVTPWLVPLEPEHYGARERETIYQLRVPALPWDLQDTITRAKSLVLKQLATPLEIQKFFDAIPTIDRDQFRYAKNLISEAIRQAHQNSIERTVIEQIEQRGDIRAAVAIWALLKVADKFSISRLINIEDALADTSSDWDRGITPLVRFFVASRNLRQTDDVVTYYHPRVEAGIVQALTKERVIAGKALRTLIDVWLSLHNAGEWGASVAANLIAAIPKDSGINLKLHQSATKQIDSWLEANLSDPPGKLEAAFELIAAAGSTASAQAEVARYLLSSPIRRGVFLDNWEKPERNEEWYSRHRSEPATKPLLERFIREVLPWSHSWYRPSFARDLLRLAPDLSEAFLDAAHRIVHLGVTHNDDAIAEGALEDLAGFEDVVKEAVKARKSTSEETAEKEALRLALINGEYSEEYAEHLSTPDEDGYTAGELLKAYACRLHKTGNWKQLATHIYRDSLRWYWLEAVRDEVKGPGFDDEDDVTPTTEIKLEPDEIQALFDSAYNSPEEDDLWYLLSLIWEHRFLAPLLARIKEGSCSAKARLAALRCLLVCVPEKLKEISDDLQTTPADTRLVEIALDLAHLSGRMSPRDKGREPDASAAMQQLPPAVLDLGLAFLDVLNDRLPSVGEAARQLLGSTDGTSEDVRRLRLAIGRATDAVWQEDLNSLLRSSEDPNIAAEAVKAAAREKQEMVLEHALTHKFASVRATALEAIALDMPAPLPPRLLGMVSDKGQAVRKTLGSLLARKVHPAHRATLMQLVGDKYSTGTHYVDDNATFPIARAAVQAMKEYPTLGRDGADWLLEIAISSGDPKLRSHIFDLLATHARSAGQEILFDLATQPGRNHIRSQAAAGFFSALGSVDAGVVSKITPELLSAQPGAIAAALAVVLGADGEVEAIKHVAIQLAANPKRRVLVLLLIRIVSGRIPELASELADMLPSKHPALHWALGGEIDWKSDQLLSDLGEPGVCHEVFVYMQPNEN